MSTISVLLATLVAIGLPQSGGGNLLVNGDARRGAEAWTPHGLATIEQVAGIPCFTVRSGGSFWQDVALPGAAAGQYAALSGRGQSERINADGAITGLPYLYATVATADRHRFVAYWQGQSMLGRPERPGDWVPMWGIFKIADEARYVYVQLNQAERRGVPQDGSAAHFADVHLHLFPTEAAARAFVEQYR